MPVSNFHKNAQRIDYPSFDGGLNLSVPPSRLKPNELQEAKNVEFDASAGAMKVRGGLVWLQTFSSIHPEAPFAANHLSRIRSGAYIFREGTSEIAAVATISDTGTVTIRHVVREYVRDIPIALHYTGSGIVNNAIWDTEWQCLVASGGKLQRAYARNNEWWGETISASPDGCRQVFTRDGRVGVVSENYTLRFSAVGDYTSWSNDPSDSSSGQFLDIGYKDGMDIDVVVPLSKDLIIFKSPRGDVGNGTIWRLIGSYPNWQVVEAAHNTGTFGINSVCAVGDDVYYVTPSGLAALSAVNDYSEIRANWPDRKINRALQNLIDETAQLWNIPSKQQLWFRPNDRSSFAFVFDYAKGIWTEFDFPVQPIFACEQKKEIYLFSEDDIFSIQQNLVNDWLANDVKKPISAALKMGTIENSHQTLAKGAVITYMYQDNENDAQSSGKLLVGKYELNMKNDGEQEWQTARSRFMARDYSITPQIRLTGSCAVSKASIEIAEV